MIFVRKTKKKIRLETNIWNMTYSLTKELCFLFSDREKRKSKINADTKRNEPIILKLKLKKLTMVV